MMITAAVRIALPIGPSRDNIARPPPAGSRTAKARPTSSAITGVPLVESGFDPASSSPVNPANIKPNTSAVRALYREMLDKARERPETLYGSSPSQIARAKIQALALADEFPSVVQDLIAVGVKTHFVYHVVARNNGYKAPLPDVLEDRPGAVGG